MLGFDCSRPKYIDAFDHQSFCNLGIPTPKPGHPTAAYEVAQVVWVTDTAGWVYHAVSTLTTHICGLWGYEKAVPSMMGRTKMTLSPSQCQQIVNRGTFKTKQGCTISGIMALGFTITEFNVRGWDGIRGGNNACHGVKSFNEATGEEVERTVQSMYLEFTIPCVQLKMDYKTKVITVAGSGEKLACAVGASDIKSAPKFAGCVGVGETYIWPRLKKLYCPLHYIRSIKGILMGRTFSAKQHMVAFHVTNQRA